VFVESDVEEETTLKHNGYFETLHSVYRNKLKIESESFRAKKCFNLKAYDLYKEQHKVVSKKYKYPGYVSVTDDFNSKKYAVKYFYL